MFRLQNLLWYTPVQISNSKNLVQVHVKPTFDKSINVIYQIKANFMLNSKRPHICYFSKILFYEIFKNMTKIVKMDLEPLNLNTNSLDNEIGAQFGPYVCFIFNIMIFYQNFHSKADSNIEQI